MQCQNCGKDPANVQINNQQETISLCNECAAMYLGGESQGCQDNKCVQSMPQNFMPQIVAVIPMFPQMFQQDSYPDISCPSCGSSFREYMMQGVLSCPGCYEAFENELHQQAVYTFGMLRHRGKAPERTCKHLQLRKRIEDLRYKMEREVERENYTDAAKIRDSIRELENEAEELLKSALMDLGRGRAK